MTHRSSVFVVLSLAFTLFVLALVLLEASAALPAQAGSHGFEEILSEGFEGAFPPTGWNSTGHWGKSGCEASDGASSAWIEGSATDRACTGFDSIYHPNEAATMRYGPFDLSDALTATLTFDLWLWQAQGDTFAWGASIDGTVFHGITATDAFTTLWAAQSLDLGAVPGLGDLRGQPAVYVGFIWQTDDFAETFSGAFVDNVRIAKGVGGDTSAAHLYLPAVNGAPAATSTATATATATATSVPGNHAPVFPTPFLSEKVTENEYDGNGRLVGATTTITILTPATDQDGDPITYAWSASNGSIAGNGLVGVWTRVIESGRVKKGVVTVVADDGRGGTAQVSFEVN